MDPHWLAKRLAEGHSIEAIARETGRHPSAVAYWVNKHGLCSTHAERHAPRDPIPVGTLQELVERGLSIRQIATELDRSAATIRHWLKRYGLTTSPRYVRGEDKPATVMRECRTHGWVDFRLYKRTGFRCPLCVSEGVTERRRQVKAQLVAEAGGCCALCGYDKYIGALQFHHLDPAEKAFSISREGTTVALDQLRGEAAKCVLLCANCHAEVEAGVTSLPRSLYPV